MLKLIALIHKLMSSGHHFQSIRMIKFLCDILNKKKVTAPKRKPAPRGLSLNPTAASSGSLHNKSEPAPF
jgi:hypothetical protein